MSVKPFQHVKEHDKGIRGGTFSTYETVVDVPAIFAGY